MRRICLNGESVPVEKDAAAEVSENAPLGDRLNMVFSGCSVSYGRGRAIVTETGMDTQMGKKSQSCWILLKKHRHRFSKSCLNSENI